ncbi:unnamed protein product [Hymenolepis diminuta]|uniref:Uncharacterized protein n=1 Tax=Hymenolepis diminuta TaxID=6216 RepID=A0A0R3ST59_HYMDI|nr:unnamed protein product [Hymenolepis diminuta]
MEGCRKYAWIALSLLLLFFCIIFVVSGTHLMFTDVKLSEKCNDDKLVQSRPDIAKACEEERFMINTGYAMSCIGLIFGLGFIVINVCFCVKMTGRARNHDTELCEYPSEQAHTSETDSAEPPDYDAACRVQVEIDDDSVSYRPPSIPPPPSSQQPSQTIENNHTPQRHK